MAKKSVTTKASYIKFIASLKSKIRSAQVKGAIAVNRELIRLYWELGKDIVEKQKVEKWGSNVLERVAKDLQSEFPGVEGFSRSNIFYMRSFYIAHAKVQLAVGQFEIKLVEKLPKELKASLPTVQEIEAELSALPKKRKNKNK